jgi:hypothetical protein
MKTDSKNIELSILAADANSEVDAMVRELEGLASSTEASGREGTPRFILAGTKLAFGSKKAGVRN